jgi:flavin-dependent dehydrogenase
MLIDACQLPLGETLETEVCIIGAGPAGISLAREFVGLNIQVTLLESGGFEYEPETQLLASGSTIGDAIPPINVNHRQFGGNSNVWAIKIKPNQFGLRHAVFDEIDFEKRDWVPHSGWPFSRHHLAPYYERRAISFSREPKDARVSG